MDLSPYQHFLHELALLSGDYLCAQAAAPALAVETKADASPVTAADRGAEALLRHAINTRFPTHGILGEEMGEERTGADWVWVLDPIDGTKSFITGVPLWTTLIALLHEGRPVLGAIHQPVLGQLLLGDGTMSTLNGQPVRVRPCPQLSAATLLTSDPLNPAVYQDGEAFAALSRRARLVRTWGDGYGYLLVATGRADVMLDPIMNPWDIAALVPVIEGAGGVISDWHGHRAYPANSTVAAAPELHPAIIAALRGEEATAALPMKA